jgi:hypothetical protein
MKLEFSAVTLDGNKMRNVPKATHIENESTSRPFKDAIGLVQISIIVDK